MLLYATGDSFTYGAELAEYPGKRVCYDHKYREKHAYPARLAEHLGLEKAINEGFGGGSNNYIIRKAMTFLSQWIADGKPPSEVFVVVGWSFPSRNEFFFPRQDTHNIKYLDVKDNEEGYIQHFSNMWVDPTWPNDVKKFVGVYTNRFMWGGEGNTRYAIYLLGMQSFLKQHGFPYLFFNSCWSATPEVSESGIIFSLIDQTRCLGLYDKMEGMNCWCTYVKKTKQLPHGHPNEDGHDAWAKHLADHITSNNLLWLSSE